MRVYRVYRVMYDTMDEIFDSMAGYSRSTVDDEPTRVAETVDM